MNKDYIHKWITDFIYKNINIKIDSSISFLDPRNGMMPRDLIMLFFTLQDEFNIKFTEKDIIEKRFDYIDNIIDSIAEKIN